MASPGTVYTHHRTLRLLYITKNHQIMKDVKNYFQMLSQILRLQHALPSASINDWGLTLFSASSLKPHHFNVENAWNKHVWSQLNKNRLTEKATWQGPKSSFGKKKKKIALWREFVAGAFTYQLLKCCQVTMAHRNKEATRHHSLCFLTSQYFPWIW